MRRAAILAFRTARRFPANRSITSSSNSSWRASVTSYGVNLRSLSATSRRENAASPNSRSSMYFRTFSLALVTTVGGFGAWYAYGPNPASQFPAGASSIAPSLPVTIPGSSQQSRGISTGGASSSTSSAAGSSSTSPPTPESTRRALVVDNDQFYTGSIVGDQPLEKTSDDAGRKILEMMTPEQATGKLRRNEESYLVGRGRGVVRYDVVQIPSNNPIEDDHAEKIVEVPQSVAAAEDGTTSSDWMFWGVFDGHSGWTTSAKLREVLIGFVARELNATYKSAISDPTLRVPTPESIDAAIKNGFMRLDHEIIHESVEKVVKANSKRVAAELLAPALSGSCALLSFYDSRSKLLRVACTGDSRAVLGRRVTTGKWTATPLSVDQTGGNEEEAARLRREHPGEERVVHNGRILGGLEPSRAFGDSFYKWTRETQDRVKQSFFGRSPSQLLRTPPYVTAEPVITTTKVDPQKGDFVVMATDGLWEMLTNEEVVGLVGQWLDAQPDRGIGGAWNRAAGGQGSTSASWLKSWFGTGAGSGLPVEKNAAGIVQHDGQRLPVRQRQWGVDSSVESRFVVEDKNVATHLVRNALGGRDRDMVCALLTLPSPYSRRYRDDLTVEVIFFGEGDSSGNVIPNDEATANPAELRAKL
ncbi:MAG: hypothetical protein M1825_000742 [Sarcosagium campestre]|nr:MAG: hypothetical protein M1825_000742 [Sarcosagium campestre]